MRRRQVLVKGKVACDGFLANFLNIIPRLLDVPKCVFLLDASKFDFQQGQMLSSKIDGHWHSGIHHLSPVQEHCCARLVHPIPVPD